jgi:hypothetical protein
LKTGELSGGVSGGNSKLFYNAQVKFTPGIGISNVEKASVKTNVKRFDAGASVLYPGTAIDSFNNSYMAVYRFEDTSFLNETTSMIEDIQLNNQLLGLGVGLSW